MSMQPWSVTSSFVSLLLVLHTNAAYSRWTRHESHGAPSRTHVTPSVIWQSDEPLKRRVISRCAAFPHALAYHVGEQTPRKRAQSRRAFSTSWVMPTGRGLVQARQSPSRSTLAICGCNQPARPAAREARRVRVDMMEQLGKSERLFRTPIRAYTRHTASYMALLTATRRPRRRLRAERSCPRWRSSRSSCSASRLSNVLESPSPYCLLVSTTVASRQRREVAPRAPIGSPALTICLGLTFTQASVFEALHMSEQLSLSMTWCSAIQHRRGTCGPASNSPVMSVPVA